MSAQIRAALEDFCTTVEASGGLMMVDDELVPVADEEWPDLAISYLKACTALGRTPVTLNVPEEET